MERNFYDDDEFEDFLKQKADLYSLYPSERAWEGIYRSLHSPRRKWHTATGILLLITTMLFISLEIVSTNRHLTSAKASKDSIALSRTLSGMQRTLATATIVIPGTAVISNETYRNDKGGIEITSPVLISASVAEQSTLSGPDQTVISPPKTFIPQLATSPALNKANASTEEKKERINWLHDMAQIRLSPFRNKRLHLQFYISPGASYRKLNSYKRDAAVSVSSVAGDPVNLDRVVDQQPAFGLEAGSAVLYNISDHFILKGGVQLNFVRYNINAYKSAPERAAITLSSANPAANTHETITTYSSLRNSNGRYPQDLQNQYLQISLPIGAEFKVLGDKRFQLNIAGTLQPTYLLYNNTYLLTSDYGNYTKQPDLVRKWNVNAAAEAYISYSLGGVRWQAGPQFRYQLLSSYTDRYPVREYLTEYGIKIGVTKTLK